ncbi:hypothetical protein [Paractinoplanes rishiriensis]|uniref:hypothetical protein n=1 Tax=Paractinoplanes rishiriensis TaxID=1050105 RepID=UPI00194198ED|nr:hypothetical protein [Actinoplanes rishiriensis]
MTAGGSGPCYRLTTDDGTQYALYSGDGITLVKGDRIKINTKPALVRISCGPGRFVEIVAVEPVR